jgi:hypothetical protein
VSNKDQLKRGMLRGSAWRWMKWNPGSRSMINMARHGQREDSMARFKTRRDAIASTEGHKRTAAHHNRALSYRQEELDERYAELAAAHTPKTGRAERNAAARQVLQHGLAVQEMKKLWKGQGRREIQEDRSRRQGRRGW